MRIRSGARLFLFCYSVLYSLFYFSFLIKSLYYILKDKYTKKKEHFVPLFFRIPGYKIKYIMFRGKIVQSSESIGKHIRMLRQNKNLSQQQLADLMFVTRKTIGNWENGYRMPDITMLSRLSKCLGVHPIELLEDPNDEDAAPIIIIIEDEAILLKGFVHLCEASLPSADIYGFEIGAEALRFAERNPVSIAFLDIELFGENGIDLADRLLAINPHTNIIFLTGHSEYMSDALRLHCSGYILKPLTPEKIANEIAHLRHPVRGVTT